MKEKNLDSQILAWNEKRERVISNLRLKLRILITAFVLVVAIFVSVLYR